jgi:FlaA1/EpsC-like NDP-sugar epimerase
MNAAKRRFVLSGLKLFDISLLILSFGLATVFVAYGDKGVGLEQFFSMRVKLSNCIAFVSIVLAWHIIFSFCGLYESRRLSARHAELVDVIKATSLSSVLLAVLAASHRITMITPSFLASFWLVSSFLMTASRLVLRPLLASLRRRGRNLRYVLVLGTNPRAIDFARKIEAIPELGYRILGFVDDDWHGMPEFQQTGFPLVSAYKDLPEFLRRNVVDEVAMYLPF